MTSGEYILLVEDDAAVVALIREGLSADGYALAHAQGVNEAWRMANGRAPDLIILDLGLPDGSGLALCRKIRRHPALASVPVIMLTGQGQLRDKALGFEAGADHYLVKPIEVAELRLWVEALLRRIRHADREGGILRAEDFVVDPHTRAVQTAGATISSLTAREFDLLYELVRRRPRILSRDFFLKKLWGETLRDNTVDACVKNIRAKLGAASRRIVTVHGAGYRFE
jgi:two-component system catabolic regulation response regulator CreB